MNFSSSAVSVREGVERDNHGQAEGEHVFDVLLKVRDAGFERRHVKLAEVFFRDATVHLKSADGGYYDDRVRLEASETALDVEEFSAPRSAANPASVTK